MMQHTDYISLSCTGLNDNS